MWNKCTDSFITELFVLTCLLWCDAVVFELCWAVLFTSPVNVSSCSAASCFTFSCFWFDLSCFILMVDLTSVQHIYTDVDQRAADASHLFHCLSLCNSVYLCGPCTQTNVLINYFLSCVSRLQGRAVIGWWGLEVISRLQWICWYFLDSVSRRRRCVTSCRQNVPAGH